MPNMGIAGDYLHLQTLALLLSCSEWSLILVSIALLKSLLSKYVS